MEYFRFTLFNNITLLIVALTVLTAVLRWRSPRSQWPLLYYPVVASYTLAFDGSFNKLWLGYGVTCAILIRSGITRARWPEVLFLGYVLWRSVGLLLMW